MTPTAFYTVCAIVVACLIGPVLLFVIALLSVARDADELAREHAARKRAETIRALEKAYALPEPQRDTFYCEHRDHGWSDSALTARFWRAMGRRSR